jgi:hypothetical protein
MRRPNEETLESYHLRKIPAGPRLKALESHLLACSACAERAKKAAQYVDAMRAAMIVGNFDIRDFPKRRTRRK